MRRRPRERWLLGSSLKHQVIFYYFGSQEELLVAVFRRLARTHRDRLEAALASDRPISAMWEINRDPEATRLTREFLALANHSETIRKELAQNADAIRTLEERAIGLYLQQWGITPRLSPATGSILTNALGHLLVQEAALGISAGHAEIEASVEASLRDFESVGRTIEAVEPIVEPMSAVDKG